MIKKNKNKVSVYGMILIGIKRQVVSMQVFNQEGLSHACFYCELLWFLYSWVLLYVKEELWFP